MKVQHRQLERQERKAWRVLIVDDHKSFRSCARVLLESEGYDVVGEAADGVSAVALAAELEPTVVLLDIQLPDLDGFAVAQRMTEHVTEQMAGPDVVLTSGRAPEDYGRRLTDSRHAFLPKDNLSGASLEAVLEAALEDRE